MSETETAVFKVFIRGPIEKVWREITKTDEVQQCFFNMKMDTNRMEVGGEIRMRTKSGKNTGAVGEILVHEPPHRFGHTFRFTQYDDPPCKVFYDLKEVDGGTEFTMTLEDLPKGSKTAKDMVRGGPMITNTLKAIVETGRPTLGTRALYVVFGLMEPLSPKSMRTENWPLP